MTCECIATFSDAERRERWRGIFTEDRVPILGPLIQGRATHPDRPEEVYFYYLLDLRRVSKEQLEEIHRRAQKAFPSSAGKMTLEELAADSLARGIPIRANDVSILWCKTHVLIAVRSGDDQDEEFDQDDQDDDEEFQE